MASLLGEQSRFLLFFKSMPSGKCHFFTFIRRNNDSRHLIWLIKCDFFLLCSTLYFGKTSIFFSNAGASRGKKLLFIMAIPVVDFSSEGYKIRKVFGEKQNI